MFSFFDTLIYGLGCVVVANYYWRKVNPRLRFPAVLLMILTPHLLISDQGNTQTNFLAVGLFLFSFRAALSNNFALSAVIAVLSSFSKQTVLCMYPPFLVITLSRIY